MKVSIFCLLFIFVFNNVYSQEDGVNCILLDNDTNLVSNANIITINHSFGYISAEDGFFSIPISILPVELEISHIGYQTKRIILKDSLVTIPDGLLKIFLQKKVHVFNEVEVLDKNTKILSKREKRWVMTDYDIRNEYIMVLYTKGAKRKIKCISPINNESFEVDFNFSASKIVSDQLGNTFLMNNEKALQFVILQNDSICFYPAINTSDYINIIKPIVGEANGFLGYSALSKHNQKITYWTARKDKRYLIHEIYNDSRYSFAQGCIEERNQLIQKYGNINDMGDLNIDLLQIKRRIKRLNWTYTLIGTIPEYSPAYIKQDTIIVFDHVNSFILSFDVYGNMLDSVTIDYHKNKSWGKEILFDQEQQLFYTKLIRNGRVCLYLINIETGKLSYTCEIDGTIIPEKMTLYDGKIYFMSFDIHHQRILVQQKII